MDKRHFQIGLATVLLLVALRLALGCHFLYEGVWKIRHHDEFTAEPFLTQAKGPLSGVFYAMLDDIDGRRRLQKDLTVAAAGKEKRPGDALAAVKDAPLDDRWDGIRKKFLGCYRSEADDLAAKAQNIFKAHAAAMEKYLAEVLPDIQAHFAAVDRFEAAAAGSPDTAFQRERRWKEMQNLRGGEGLAQRTRRPRRRLQTRPARLDPRRETEGRLSRRGLEPALLEPHPPDQLRRDLRPDGDWVVPDARALHAAGGVGRGGLHVLRRLDAAGLAGDLSARPGGGRPRPAGEQGLHRDARPAPRGEHTGGTLGRLGLFPPSPRAQPVALETLLLADGLPDHEGGKSK